MHWWIQEGLLIEGNRSPLIIMKKNFAKMFERDLDKNKMCQVNEGLACKEVKIRCSMNCIIKECKTKTTS